MSWWVRRSTADRVLAGALVTRRHFLKGAAILGVAVAVAPRVLVQVPESYLVAPDDHATHVALHIRLTDKMRSLAERVLKDSNMEIYARYNARRALL